MSLQRIALAQVARARGAEGSVEAAERWIAQAGAERARVVCLPEEGAQPGMAVPRVLARRWNGGGRQRRWES